MYCVFHVLATLALLLELVKAYDTKKESQVCIGGGCSIDFHTS